MTLCEECTLLHSQQSIYRAYVASAMLSRAVSFCSAATLLRPCKLLQAQRSLLLARATVLGAFPVFAGDMESEKCHLSGIIVRDLSCIVSNYRSTKSLDQYLKEQNVLGATFRPKTTPAAATDQRLQGQTAGAACSCHLSVRRPERHALACAGIADVDTREITRRLRDTGALNGIITTDMGAPVEELVEKTKSWSILGKVHLQTLPSKSCGRVS